jgi:hypothetical protein
MLLRMPRFNMSPDESRAIVNYFAAVSRSTNPGAGVTWPYVNIEQKQPDYWERRTAQYVQRLKDRKQLDARLKEMKPIWDAQAKKELEEAKAGLETLKKAAEEARTKKAPDLADRQKAVSDAEARIKAMEEQAGKGDHANLRKRWETHEAYAQDAFKLLLDKDVSCIKCHDVGKLQSESPQGPNLAYMSERLRPDWTEWWISHPNRMFPYAPVMPQNFPNEPNYAKKQDLFVGSGLDQIRAVRDVLLDMPRLSELPGIKAQTPGGTGGGK